MLKICSVIVTYGTRKHLLEQVVNALFRQSYPVARIVIVNNNSVEETKSYLTYLIESGSPVEVVNLDYNSGSAYGYKVGLMKAVDNDCDYFWLLDDDNMPADDALQELINAWGKLSKIYSPDRLALLSLRDDREQYVRIVCGESVEKCFGRPNSFLSFHVQDLPQKVISKIYKQYKTQKCKSEYAGDNKSCAWVPYAPYGGLFFPRHLIKIIGFPNERFYLYSDDHEYTYRITAQSGKIFLVPGSKIYDLEKSWHITSNKGKKFMFPGILKIENSKDIFRLYYTVRNRVYFEKKSLVNNRLLFFLNIVIYSLAILMFAGLFLLISNRRSLYIKQSQIYLAALNDGLCGKLGVNSKYKFD